ncbi:MAG: TMEM165/GDT1 family protein [Spirochaetia bacterium]|nr:TMEM165/GDT1 family protein [Spirochaetia bacterium]
METIFQSFLLVAITEMGDKTQLLALVLASRFKKPWVIMAGILTATVLNHLLASFAGAWLSNTIPPDYMRYGLAVTFFVFAAWVLVPDKDGEEKTYSGYGAFLTTTISFFLAEMADKTQLSTIALAAKYHNVFLVTTGTTLGMLFSDGLAVFLGERITQLVSMRWIRIAACALFVVFGVAVLFGY